MTRCTRCNTSANGAFTLELEPNGDVLCLGCKCRKDGVPIPKTIERVGVVYTSFMDSFRRRAVTMNGQKVG